MVGWTQKTWKASDYMEKYAKGNYAPSEVMKVTHCAPSLKSSDALALKVKAAGSLACVERPSKRIPHTFIDRVCLNYSAGCTARSCFGLIENLNG